MKPLYSSATRIAFRGKHSFFLYGKPLSSLKAFCSVGPHTIEETRKIEMVQICATRWTLNNYARTTCVTSLLSQLSWQTLEERRSVARLVLFYKIINGLVAVPLPDYIQPTHRISRYCHPMTFRQIHTGKDNYK